jgi:hypothetical protein
LRFCASHRPYCLRVRWPLSKFEVPSRWGQYRSTRSGCPQWEVPRVGTSAPAPRRCRQLGHTGEAEWSKKLRRCQAGRSPRKCAGRRAGAHSGGAMTSPADRPFGLAHTPAHPLAARGEKHRPWQTTRSPRVGAPPPALASSPLPRAVSQLGLEPRHHPGATTSRSECADLCCNKNESEELYGCR